MATAPLGRPYESLRSTALFGTSGGLTRQSPLPGRAWASAERRPQRRITVAATVRRRLSGSPTSKSERSELVHLASKRSRLDVVRPNRTRMVMASGDCSFRLAVRIASFHRFAWNIRWPNRTVAGTGTRVRYGNPLSRRPINSRDVAIFREYSRFVGL